MKFLTITLGCKVNLYETEALIFHLTQKGWIYLNDNSHEIPDVCIVNTCTVTATSDQKSRQMLRQLRRNYPNCILVAMGCFVQTHIQDVESLADILIGTKDKSRVCELVEDYIEKKRAIHHVFDISNYTIYDEMKLGHLSTHTRGFVKIQDGCENFCSYCLIPYARGKIKSRIPENVIDEINQLIQSNTKEVIISGINTGTYGQDLGNINLAGLIERIMNETSLWRLRLSSIELMEISDQLLATIKKYKERIAMHLHIPLQGGSDSVLARMKRKYTTSEYAHIIQKIRDIFPDIAITTDCLAGFVGETEEEFKETLNFIQEIEFANMHVFPYSRRKGTIADGISGHLESGCIKERARKMIEIAGNMKENYQKKFVGQTFELLVEQKKGDYWIGHTSNYLEIYFQTEIKGLENTIQICTIQSLKKGKLYGTIKKEEQNAYIS